MSECYLIEHFYSINNSLLKNDKPAKCRNYYTESNKITSKLTTVTNITVSRHIYY